MFLPLLFWLVTQSSLDRIINPSTDSFSFFNNTLMGAEQISRVYSNGGKQEGICGYPNREGFFVRLLENTTQYHSESLLVPKNTNPQEANPVYRFKKINGKFKIQTGILTVTSDEKLSRPPTANDYRFTDSYRQKKLDSIDLRGAIPHPTDEKRFWIETTAFEDGTANRQNIFKRALQAASKVITLGRKATGRRIHLEFKCEDTLEYLDKIDSCKLKNCTDPPEFPSVRTVSFFANEIREIGKLESYQNAFDAWTDEGKRSTQLVIHSEDLKRELRMADPEDPLFLFKMHSNCSNFQTWITCSERFYEILKPYENSREPIREVAKDSQALERLKNLRCGTGGINFYNFSIKEKWIEDFNLLFESCVNYEDDGACATANDCNAKKEGISKISSQWKNRDYRKKILENYQELKSLVEQLKRQKSPSPKAPSTATQGQ